MYTYDDALKASIEYFNGNELTAKVFVDKYALRDNDNNILEKTPTQTHRRLAKEFARIEKKKFKNPLTEDQIFGLFDQFKTIIPQGSPIFAIGNPYQYVSSSNCFVIAPPEDSYGGICRFDEEIVQISKRRGGVGGDLSTLRPNNTATSNSSRTSTGIIPFATRFSNSTREVGQSSRRGACMLSLSVHHPESIIVWDEDVDGKPYNVHVEQENFSFNTTSEYYNPKKIDFVTCKYDRTKVTGANISVRITDAFMNAAINKQKYQQQWPVDSDKPSIVKQVDAAKAWDKIIHSAWQTAEPGVLFWDTIIKESIPDCYSKYGLCSAGVNPCAELMLVAYDSCRLLAINLFSFVHDPFTKDAYFDYAECYRIAQLAQRLADDLIDLEIECVDRIIGKINKDPEKPEIKARELNLWQKIKEMAIKCRRTGTGITGLGDTLAALNIAYGSDQGISVTDSIYRTLKFGTYKSSIDMAKEIGTFPIWDHKLEKDNPFLNRFNNEFIHLGPSNKITGGPKDPSYSVVNGKDLYEEMKKYGRRNIALLTTAPAGTISILSKLINRFDISSGIEPRFSAVPYIRRKKINPNDKNARIDFTDQNGDHFQEFEVYPSAIQEWMDITGIKDINKSPWHGNCAEELDWKQRVKLQAAAQKHVDHSISSTLNLPEDVSVDKVKEIYETAWKSGCKGLTVYRKNCRTGILVDKKSKSQPTDIGFQRPKEVEADIWHCRVSKRLDKIRTFDYIIAVGKIDGKCYEVFSIENGHIDKKQIHGKIVRISQGKYNIVLDNGTIVENITSGTTEEEDSLTRLVSTCLRFGVDITAIIEQLSKSEGNLFCFARGIVKALKKYVKDGVKVVGGKCGNPDCNSTEIIYQNNCPSCRTCGWSKCG